MNVYAFVCRGSRPLLRLRLAGQRRLNSTKPNNTAKDAPARSTTIPGPGMAWIEPLKEPFRAYGRMQHRSPYMTQLSTTLIIYYLGDLSAQMVSGTEPYEPARGLRALVIGGISSIPNYKWFMFLGNHFNYRSHVVSIATKIVINQSIFTPCFNTYFFGMQSLLSGQTLAQTKQRVLDTVPVSWRNSWKLWPAVTAFSFTFIAPSYRSVFAGVIAIGWQTYLSWLNMKAQKEEEEKQKVPQASLSSNNAAAAT